jgi:hypothetical protein
MRPSRPPLAVRACNAPICVAPVLARLAWLVDGLGVQLHPPARRGGAAPAGAGCLAEADRLDDEADATPRWRPLRVVGVGKRYHSLKNIDPDAGRRNALKLKSGK